MIVIDGELRDIIHDNWVYRPACAVRRDRRIMDFRRWPCSGQPQSQVAEDCPNHRRIFDETDDPHDPPTLWADQGVNYPGLRRDRLRSFVLIAPSDSEATVWLENAEKIPDKDD